MENAFEFTVEAGSNFGSFEGRIRFLKIHDRFRGKKCLGVYNKFEVWSDVSPDCDDEHIFLPGTDTAFDGEEIDFGDPITLMEVVKALYEANKDLSKKLSGVQENHVQDAYTSIRKRVGGIDDCVVPFEYNPEKTPEENAWDLCAWKVGYIENILNHIPLGSDQCPFCLAYIEQDKPECSYCEFGKEKGICIGQNDSKYLKLLTALSALKDAVAKLYLR